MGRRRTDSIDVACREWAKQRRRVLGLDELATAREYLGAIRCTLAQRRDLHAGARSHGRVDQHFPEVYTDVALDVHRAYRAMRIELRDVLDVHYVARAPVDLKAAELHVSLPTYWTRLTAAKAFVEGWLTR